MKGGKNDGTRSYCEVDLCICRVVLNWRSSRSPEIAIYVQLSCNQYPFFPKTITKSFLLNGYSALTCQPSIVILILNLSIKNNRTQGAMKK